MIDPAFLDRLHYYLPGWEAPKLEARLFTSHFGFVSDYFAEALRQMRKRSLVRAIDEEFALGSHLSARDEKAVRKTVSGLLKILHPHGEWTRSELREYVEFALEGRRRVKEQLKKLATHDYAKTAFSYIERDTGHEYWVEVPEQPDDLDAVIDSEAEEARAEVETRPSEAATVHLIAAGESKYVEFKQTGRINLHTQQRDPVIEQMVVKSIAGFMNAEGGTLLIGVTDAGQVSGIETDFKTLGKKQDQDGFALWLNGLVDNTLGATAAANVHIAFEKISDQTVCRVDVKPGKDPTFARRGKGEADLYVRLNNATRLLNTAEALEYVRTRWR
jgi:ATP-dependent Lon protease